MLQAMGGPGLKNLGPCHLYSHHVRMHRLIFYIENTLIKLILRA